MKHLNVIFISLGLVLFFFDSCETIDKENFDFSNYIQNNEDINLELKRWDVDTAFIQFIGFPPSEDYEYYQKLSMNGKFGAGVFPKTFFDEYDLNKPILIFYALRKNTVEGNTFDDAGISSEGMVDYENGVGRTDARNLHSLGNYSKTTYRYSEFYTAFPNGKFRMLSEGYSSDRLANEFYKEIVLSMKEFSEARINPNAKFGLYIRGKNEIIMVDRATFLRTYNKIQTNETSEEENSNRVDSMFAPKKENKMSEVIDETSANVDSLSIE